MSLPFIVAAFWGVFFSQESAIRMYLYFFLFNFAVDFWFMIDGTFVHDPCGQLPGMLQKHGDAFLCGVVRLIAFFFLLFSTVLQLYLAFVIWSLAEDLKVGGANRWHDLEKNASEAKRKEAYSKYSNGFFGCDKGVMDGYGSVPRIRDGNALSLVL